MGERMAKTRDNNPNQAPSNDASMTRRTMLPVFASLAVLPASLSAKAMEQTSDSEAGTIWWAELRTRAPQQTNEFYAKVFGWTPKAVAQADMERAPQEGEQAYTLFTKNGQEVAGAEEITPSAAATAKPGWITYIQVADIDEATRMVTENGGKVIQPSINVPTVGRIAEVEDPEGNRIGIVAPRK